MTRLPPEAAGPQGDAPAADDVESRHPPGALPVAAPVPTEGRPRGGGIPGSRPLPPVRPSGAPVELTLDLLGTPPDKVLPRIFGALERVSPDVTLYVLLRDTPEYVGVVANVYQALRIRGYYSDSSRTPTGAQRLKIRRRHDATRHYARAPHRDAAADALYVPAPAGDFGAPAEAAPPGNSGTGTTPDEGRRTKDESDSSGVPPAGSGQSVRPSSSSGAA